MKLRKSGFCLAIFASVLFLSGAPARASEITDLYIKAMDKNDKAALDGIVKYKKDAIPGEIQSLLEHARAPETTPEDRDSLLYIAEHMAIRYKDQTGDFAPLLEVKKRTFDSRLSAPVTPELVDGARIVDIPRASGDVKNIFVPDNIVVKLGDTVRWTNSDEIAHVFSTMGAISAGKFYASNIPAGESWEFKFDKPGEYFYICFIHQSMVGKVTVEGAETETEATSAPATPEAPEVAEAPAPAPSTTPDEEDGHHDHGAPAPPAGLHAE